MGPRPRGRGIGGGSTGDFGSSGLQWGRDRAVAEFFWLCGRSALWNNCFNGAATARSRNYAAARRKSIEQLTLQWGRDRAVAELLAHARMFMLDVPLQWGRDRAVAELLKNRPRPAMIVRFNGAATARSRN